MTTAHLVHTRSTLATHVVHSQCTLVRCPAASRAMLLDDATTHCVRSVYAQSVISATIRPTIGATISAPVPAPPPWGGFALGGAPLGPAGVFPRVPPRVRASGAPPAPPAPLITHGSTSASSACVCPTGRASGAPHRGVRTRP